MLCNNCEKQLNKKVKNSRPWTVTLVEDLQIAKKVFQNNDFKLGCTFCYKCRMKIAINKTKNKKIAIILN